MDQRLSKPVFAGLALVTILFLALYFVLASYNRPAADDFYFIGSVRDHGIWQTAWHAYQTWITRWTTLLFTGTMVVVAGTANSFLLFHLATLAALLAAVFLLLRSIPGINGGLFTLVLFSLLFILSFYFNTFETGETWFWFTSACMYLWPLIACGYGIYFLRGTGRISMSCAMLCMLFVGGGSEVVAVEMLLLLMLLFMIGRRSDVPALAMITKKMLLVAAGALTISLLVAWLGPGRSIRQEALADRSLGGLIVLSIKSAGYFMLTKLPLKIHWLAFGMIPWILFHPGEPGKKMELITVFRKIGRDLLILLSFIVLHFFIVVFMLHSFPPARTWITVSLALAVFTAVSGWRLGSLVGIKQQKYLATLYVVVTGILLVYYLNTESKTAFQYANAWDQRFNSLKSENNMLPEAIEVPPLPPAGMLYSAEISTDTSDYRNKHLREFLRLKRPVRVK